MRFGKLHSNLVSPDENLIRIFFLWIVSSVFGIIMSVSAFADGPAYTAHDKRDPFTPLVTSSSRQSPGLMGIERIDELTVEGIVYDPKNGSVVILNGTVLKEGEELGGVKITKIEKSGVRLLLNGTETLKSLYQDDTKGKS
jgi:hypothetical protein